MALNSPRGWLITYDIANPRRLGRLHRFLSRHAAPAQYSVFHFEGSPSKMNRLMVEIATLIDPKADDVRGYLLPESLSIDTIGRGSLPGGALLVSANSPALEALLNAVPEERPGHHKKPVSA